MAELGKDSGTKNSWYGVSIQHHLEDAYAFVDELGNKKSTFMKAVVRKVGAEGVKVAKTEYKKLHVGTGTRDKLYKSIRHVWIKSYKYDKVQVSARRDDSVLYGYAITKGSTIQAKKKKYLTFKVNEKWVKVKKVKLKSVDFLEGPVRSYLKSSAVASVVEKQLQKEIAKAEKREAKL